MKTFRLMMTAITASAILAGAAWAQDKSASYQSTLASPATPTSLPVKVRTEPTILLWTNVPATGLLVDFLKPEPAWELFNPLLPPPTLPAPVISVPVSTAPHPDHLSDNLASKEANFVFLRLSFT